MAEAVMNAPAQELTSRPRQPELGDEMAARVDTVLEGREHFSPGATTREFMDMLDRVEIATLGGREDPTEIAKAGRTVLNGAVEYALPTSDNEDPLHRRIAVSEAVDKLMTDQARFVVSPDGHLSVRDQGPDDPQSATFERIANIAVETEEEAPQASSPLSRPKRRLNKKVEKVNARAEKDIDKLWKLQDPMAEADRMSGQAPDVEDVELTGQRETGIRMAAEQRVQRLREAHAAREAERAERQEQREQRPGVARRLAKAALKAAGLVGRGIDKLTDAMVEPTTAEREAEGNGTWQQGELFSKQELREAKGPSRLRRALSAVKEQHIDTVNAWVNAKAENFFDRDRVYRALERRAISDLKREDIVTTQPEIDARVEVLKRRYTKIGKVAAGAVFAVGAGYAAYDMLRNGGFGGGTAHGHEVAAVTPTGGNTMHTEQAERLAAHHLPTEMAGETVQTIHPAPGEGLNQMLLNAGVNPDQLDAARAHVEANADQLPLYKMSGGGYGVEEANWGAKQTETLYRLINDYR